MFAFLDVYIVNLFCTHVGDIGLRGNQAPETNFGNEALEYLRDGVETANCPKF